MATPLQHISDEALFRHFKEGQGDVYLEVLWERYHHLVFAASMKYLKDKDQAKDICQIVFQRIIELPDDYMIERFSGWVGIVTRNLSLELLRKQNKHTAFSKAAVLNEESNGEEDLEEQLSHLETRVNLLNRAQQLCIRLFYLEGKSYKQVSELSGFSLNEVKTHIQNGKRNLRSLFFGR
jgi:RNA polymerase sigma factor (sigma-70 family)